MADDPQPPPRNDALHRIAGLGTRAATRAGRPFADVFLDGPGLEQAINDPHVQAALRRALAGDGGKKIVTILFETGLIDEFLAQLLTRPALWSLIDEIVASPAVTAAVTQQSLGFADLIGAEVRTRSRRADDWLERRVRRHHDEEPA